MRAPIRARSRVARSGACASVAAGRWRRLRALRWIRLPSRRRLALPVHRLKPRPLVARGALRDASAGVGPAVGPLGPACGHERLAEAVLPGLAQALGAALRAAAPRRRCRWRGSRLVPRVGGGAGCPRPSGSRATTPPGAPAPGRRRGRAKASASASLLLGRQAARQGGAHLVEDSPILPEPAFDDGERGGGLLRRLVLVGVPFGAPADRCSAGARPPFRLCACCVRWLRGAGGRSLRPVGPSRLPPRFRNENPISALPLRSVASCFAAWGWASPPRDPVRW